MQRCVAVIGLMTALAIAGESHAQHPQSHLQVQALPGGGHIFVLQTKTSHNVEGGRLELSREIKRICGAKPVHFGDFTFHVEHREGPFLFLQQISCVDVAAAPSMIVTDPTWRPTDVQQGIILELTRRYFRFKDTGDFGQVPQLLAPSLSFADWRAAAEKFSKQAGEVRYRKVEKVTWYKDPPNGPAPGVYAAVDFRGQFANVDIYCGFVVWHRGHDGIITGLLREEQNYISRDIQQRMAPNELTSRRKELGC